MASTEGGMDIEEVAEHTPEKIIKEWIDPKSWICSRSRHVKWHSPLGLEGDAFKEMVKFIGLHLYRAYAESDSVDVRNQPGFENIRQQDPRCRC